VADSLRAKTLERQDFTNLKMHKPERFSNHDPSITARSFTQASEHLAEKVQSS